MGIFARYTISFGHFVAVSPVKKMKVGIGLTPHPCFNKSPTIFRHESVPNYYSNFGHFNYFSQISHNVKDFDSKCEIYLDSIAVSLFTNS